MDTNSYVHTRRRTLRNIPTYASRCLAINKYKFNFYYIVEVLRKWCERRRRVFSSVSPKRRGAGLKVCASVFLLSVNWNDGCAREGLKCVCVCVFFKCRLERWLCTSSRIIASGDWLIVAGVGRTRPLFALTRQTRCTLSAPCMDWNSLPPSPS